MSRKLAEAVDWLHTDPELEDLIEAYPAQWQTVQARLAAMIARDDPDELKAYISGLAQPGARAAGRAQKQKDRLLAEVRRQMSIQAVKREILRASTGVTAGRVRFNLVNGYVAQKLLFRRDLDRKPVRMRAFRLIWPLLTQRRLLMPLVRSKGIWCFYSKPLIDRLAALIGDRSCLEIAAGDGTLSRFLAAAGVRITATDDYSWSASIDFPDDVRHQDARTALREHVPEVVICSWPPAGNAFEQFVFTTASVQLYIVIGSPHEESTGNREAYRRQRSFSMTTDDRLGRLVLTPEVDHVVYLFHRLPDGEPVRPSPGSPG